MESSIISFSELKNAIKIMILLYLRARGQIKFKIRGNNLRPTLFLSFFASTKCFQLSRQDPSSHLSIQSFCTSCGVLTLRLS